MVSVVAMLDACWRAEVGVEDQDGSRDSPVVVYGDFEWDDDKSLENERERGLPFRLALTLFEDPRRIDPYDSRMENGERRHALVATLGPEAPSIWRDRPLVCVYMFRNDRIRIISLRVASRKERRSYR